MTKCDEWQTRQGNDLPRGQSSEKYMYCMLQFRFQRPTCIDTVQLSDAKILQFQLLTCGSSHCLQVLTLINPQMNFCFTSSQ